MRVRKDLDAFSADKIADYLLEVSDFDECRELDSLSRMSSSSRVPSHSRVCTCISHARLTLAEITRRAYSQTSKVEFSSLFISLDRVFPEKLLNKGHKEST